MQSSSGHLFYSEDGDSKFFQNVGTFLPNCIMLCPWRQYFSNSLFKLSTACSIIRYTVRSSCHNYNVTSFCFQHIVTWWLKETAIARQRPKKQASRCIQLWHSVFYVVCAKANNQTRQPVLWDLKQRIIVLAKASSNSAVGPSFNESHWVDSHDQKAMSCSRESALGIMS
jgi:hypothetical protein